jgi:hypothetical protein
MKKEEETKEWKVVLVASALIVLLWLPPTAIVGIQEV